MDARTHYDNHLAAFYSWMIGDFDETQNQMGAYFEAHDVRPKGNGLAVDLGAGTGLQTVSLAKLGFRVSAVDFNAHLLTELRERAHGMLVTAYEGDIRTFWQQLTNEAPELIVCMGDTLTHLASVEEVAALLMDCYQASLPGSRLVLSFRPLVQELQDTRRFLPVRSDTNRIHTCFLEYFPTTVRVTDLLHERSRGGEWTQKASSYNKLRLGTEELLELLARACWQVTSQEVQRGMVYILAARH